MPDRIGRTLALDLGSKRIGVAVCDVHGSLATPLTVLARSRSPRLDHARIAEMVAEEEAVRVVVGLPVNMDGTEGAAARGARTEAAALTSLLDVPVVMVDERRSSTTAHELLAQAGRSAKSRKPLIDAVAAVVILQHWLDGQR